MTGAYVVVPDDGADNRGSFGRVYDADLFAAAGLDTRVSQCNYSINPVAGTLRGLHYQKDPWAEAKLIRCVRGRVFDVIVDLRADSPTRFVWFGAQLDQWNHHALFVPAGCAHGFVTLDPDTELHYQMSTPYHPDSAAGVRWDDPTFGIEWPRPPALISDRDATYALVEP